MRRDKRYTIYDVMEARGDFDKNPANPGARDLVTGENLYEGPIEYPKMFYHPKGETRILNPGETIVTPLGPQVVGRLHELIWQIAKNKVEAEALRQQGWHDHPAKAVAAGGGVAAPVSADQRIKELEEMIRNLQAAQADVRAEKQAELVASATQAAAATKQTVRTAVKAAESNPLVPAGAA